MLTTVLILIIICLLLLVGIIIYLVKFRDKKQIQQDNSELFKWLENENRFTRENIGNISNTVGGFLKLSHDNMFSSLKEINSEVMNNVKEMTRITENKFTELKEDMSKSLQDIRYNIDRNLKDVREETAAELNKMREIVDEKLSKTLNDRLNESFKMVSERLEAVSRSLGEVNQLAINVTDLRKVMTNVKTRGTWGEVSLENLLSNILAPEQYERSCNVGGKRSQERVDFAIVLPGTKDEKVYLPIDVKFPIETYQRLVDAIEGGISEDIILYQKQLETDIKIQAKSISEKYINPPTTTDFAVMYLPMEGLYAEVARKGGLIEELQSKYRIIPSGPSTISALLNSLQLGFKTLAIQKSTNEIFKIFSQFKKDLSIFMESIDKAQEQIDKASKQLDTATKKSQDMQKRLNKVELYNKDDETIKIDVE